MAERTAWDADRVLVALERFIEETEPKDANRVRALELIGKRIGMGSGKPPASVLHQNLVIPDDWTVAGRCHAGHPQGGGYRQTRVQKDGSEVTTVQTKVELRDKKAALELLGRHLGMFPSTNAGPINRSSQ